MLVVDGEIGFTGGINIGEAWAPPDAPDTAWRDDGVEIRGVVARTLRAAFFDVWQRFEETALRVFEPADHPLIKVLTNQIEPRPNRAIRHAYIRAIHTATKSIDIANPYFLPGPLFLHAIRDAARRGVRVRILVPEHSDVLVAGLAMSSLYGRLLTDGAQVFVYLTRTLHAKTAVFDERITMIGSHNLDALSWRFDLECDLAVESVEFARIVHTSFERDLSDARALSLASWQRRPLTVRFLAWFAALFRALM